MKSNSTTRFLNESGLFKKYYFKMTLALLLGMASILNVTATTDSRIGTMSEIELLDELQQTITGTVIDNTGEPLPGVNIIVVGTTRGSQTDFNGKYTLQASEGEILEFSYIGMKTARITVDTSTTIDVTMEEDAAALDEVVVVGYGVQKKSSLTGSVTQVDSEQLTTVSVANTTELLAGRAAGVITKQTSGIPGADGTTLNIRGFGSPLVLVDGVEMGIARIDPNEIESVNVLKDAAAAVYGARAGNGVILVTTKRGKIGKPVITYSGITSFQQPTISSNLVDGGKFTEMQNEGGAASYTPEELELYKQRAPGYETYDWEKQIYRVWAPMEQHSLTARGGSESVKFFTSLGYLDQGGQYRSGDLTYDKINVRSNVDISLSDNLTYGVDMSYLRENRSEPGRNQSAIYQAYTVSEPILPPIIPGFPELAANSGGGFGNRSATGHSERDFSGFIDRDTETFTGKMELNYKIPQVEGLSARAAIRYLSLTRQTKNLSKSYSIYEWDVNELEPRQSGTSGNNSLTESLYQYKSVQPSISLNYIRDFGDHSVNGLLLTEVIRQDYLNQSSGRKDLLSTDLPYLNLGSELGITNSGNASERGRSSVVGRINYGYKEKYFFEGAFRRDATHNFAPGNRWGFFPSLSAAWTMSKESFMENIDFVNHLKLRASYSETGRDDIGQFRYLSAFNVLTDKYAPYLYTPNGLSTAIATSGLANPDATWRNMTTYNVGIDARLFNGQLGMELDVFYRKQEGIFATPLDQFPSTFGATLPQLNQNARDNRGFDMILSHKNSFGDFKYNVAFNFGHAREKYIKWPVDRAIEAYAESEEELNDPAFIERFNLIQLREGNWVNRNIGYISDGIFMDQAEIDAHTVDQSLVAGGTGNSALLPGDVRYKDLNGDGVLNWRDLTEIGKGSLPDITYGLNMNLSYKNFTMSMLLQGASGFNFNVTAGARHILLNNRVPMNYQYKYRWTPDPNNPGVNINPNAILPASTDAGLHNNNNVTSDFWLQDGTYLRIKSLNIGYELPENITKTIGFEKIKIFGAASNLHTWNNLGIYKGTFDSEGPANQSGSVYPLIKTLSLGINVSL